MVIDCSGSMRLTDRDLEAMLAVAGGATVLGYTERCGDGEIYLLADGKRRVRSIPSGIRHGAGNGVDGEALRLGAKYHKKGEPFIWVTDGGVCAPTSAPTKALIADCRSIMQAERGVYLADTTSCVRYLKALARGARPRTYEPEYWEGY